MLIERAIRDAKLPVSILQVRDGEQAVQFFDRADRDPDAPCPDLVLLDINLPRKPGSQVLQHLRQSARCARARVIVVSTSDAQTDRSRMEELGADAYFHKPSEFDEFMKLGELVRTVLALG